MPTMLRRVFSVVWFFVHRVLLPQVISLPLPEGLKTVLVHPDLEVNTAESRSGLSREYSMALWLEQQGYLAAFVAACYNNDIEMLGMCLRDVIVEPQRAASVPCFAKAKDAALSAGALGCSLSGSGPSLFAICADTVAPAVATATVQACKEQAIECQSWIQPIDSERGICGTR